MRSKISMLPIYKKTLVKWLFSKYLHPYKLTDKLEFSAIYYLNLIYTCAIDELIDYCCCLFHLQHLNSIFNAS